MSASRPATISASQPQAVTEIKPRGARLAVLINMIAPYRRPVLACLAQRYPHLRVLVSTSLEPNRSWGLNWEGLDVVLQKTITFQGKWRHPKGFDEPLFVHVPLDTVAQLGTFKADVILSAEMGSRTLLSLLYRKLRRGSKLIIWAEISEASERGRGRLRGALRFFLARQADAFIVYGESGARYLRTLGVPESKIFVVPYSTDVTRFAANALARPAERARRLLYVGQLIDRKGLAPFLAVLSEWALEHRHCAVEFVVVGDGPLRSELDEMSRPANLKVEVSGNIPYEELPQVYADAGVFVFPTLADTWGLVVNEAMASGLPILGSIYSQAVETLVTDGQSGWTFAPDDAGQMYAAIDRCMSTPTDVLHAMRERARSSAVKHTPERIAALIDQAVMTVLAGAEQKAEAAAHVR